MYLVFYKPQTNKKNRIILYGVCDSLWCIYFFTHTIHLLVFMLNIVCMYVVWQLLENRDNAIDGKMIAKCHQGFLENCLYYVHTYLYK